MLLLISPAKTLDFETPAPTDLFTQAELLKQAKQLIAELRSLSPQALSTLMNISDKLGTLNFDRFAKWKTPFTANNAKAALFAFQGDVYTGMQAHQFTADDIAYAQKHLRILSGLYGVLRPLDLIQAYRLEMGTAFSNSHGKNLYEYWGDTITKVINKQLAEIHSQQLINLASQEYFHVIKPKLLKAEIITPIFKDKKNGQYKIISFFAKKARGMMSAYIIQQRLTDVEKIKCFTESGYEFNSSLSSEREWVFTREEGQQAISLIEN